MGTEYADMRPEDVRRWLAEAPPGTSVPVDAIRRALEPFPATDEDRPLQPATGAENADLTWREKLWLVPEDTRIGTTELAEAMDRSRDWVYRQTGAGAEDRIPHKKLDGNLVFVVGEIREWLLYREQRVSL